MFTNGLRTNRLAMLVIAFLCCFGVSSLLSPAIAADAGTLRLRVLGCQSSLWLVGARVDVSVTRGGSEVYAATDYTNGEGYARFTFASLENNDVAHVTVTPSGGNADTSHVYHWESAGLGWTLGDADGPCSDTWYDEVNNIIECVYH